jgi:hypothetical protein
MSSIGGGSGRGVPRWMFVNALLHRGEEPPRLSSSSATIAFAPTITWGARAARRARSAHGRDRAPASRASGAKCEAKA